MKKDRKAVIRGHLRGWVSIYSETTPTLPVAGREKEPALKRRTRAPKPTPELCRTFGVLQEGSAEPFAQ